MSGAHAPRFTLGLLELSAMSDWTNTDKERGEVLSLLMRLQSPTRSLLADGHSLLADGVVPEGRVRVSIKGRDRLLKRRSRVIGPLAGSVTQGARVPPLKGLGP